MSSFPSSHSSLSLGSPPPLPLRPRPSQQKQQLENEDGGGERKIEPASPSSGPGYSAIGPSYSLSSPSCSPPLSEACFISEVLTVDEHGNIIDIEYRQEGQRRGERFEDQYEEYEGEGELIEEWIEEGQNDDDIGQQSSKRTHADNGETWNYHLNEPAQPFDATKPVPPSSSSGRSPRRLSSPRSGARASASYWTSRLLILAASIGLVWITSLSLAQSVVHSYVSSPTASSLSSYWSLHFDAASAVADAFATCMGDELQACQIYNNKTLTRALRVLEGAQSANSQRALWAEQRAANYSSLYRWLLARLPADAAGSTRRLFYDTDKCSVNEIRYLQAQIGDLNSDIQRYNATAAKKINATSGSGGVGNSTSANATTAMANKNNSTSKSSIPLYSSPVSSALSSLTSSYLTNVSALGQSLEAFLAQRAQYDRNYLVNQTAALAAFGARAAAAFQLDAPSGVDAWSEFSSHTLGPALSALSGLTDSLLFCAINTNASAAIDPNCPGGSLVSAYQAANRAFTATTYTVVDSYLALMADVAGYSQEVVEQLNTIGGFLDVLANIPTEVKDVLQLSLPSIAPELLVPFSLAGYTSGSVYLVAAIQNKAAFASTAIQDRVLRPIAQSASSLAHQTQQRADSFAGAMATALRSQLAALEAVDWIEPYNPPNIVNFTSQWRGQVRDSSVAYQQASAAYLHDIQLEYQQYYLSYFSLPSSLNASLAQSAPAIANATALIMASPLLRNISSYIDSLYSLTSQYSRHPVPLSVLLHEYFSWSALNLDTILWALVAMVGIFLVLDYIYRIYASIRVAFQLLLRPEDALPPLDVRLRNREDEARKRQAKEAQQARRQEEKAKKDMKKAESRVAASGGRAPSGSGWRHLLVAIGDNLAYIYALIVLLFLLSLVGFIGVYIPVYQQYHRGCVSSTNGTVWTHNINALTWNTIELNGARVIQEPYIQFEAANAAACERHYMASLEEYQRQYQRMLSAYQALYESAQDAQLLRRCVQSPSFVGGAASYYGASERSRSLGQEVFIKSLGSTAWAAFVNGSVNPIDVYFSPSIHSSLFSDLSSIGGVGGLSRAALFNCSNNALPGCAIAARCATPNTQAGLAASSFNCGCQSEYFLHSSFISAGLVFLVFCCFNLSRGYFMQGLVYFSWKALVPNGFLMITNIKHSAAALHAGPPPAVSVNGGATDGPPSGLSKGGAAMQGKSVTMIFSTKQDRVIAKRLRRHVKRIECYSLVYFLLAILAHLPYIVVLILLTNPFGTQDGDAALRQPNKL